ncbi:MAG: hypothetical protein QNJ75_07510 [Acidimicrobiia bacterium]|nr:hypothetical protein [Acidimicrobiia bacterium]
MAARDYRSLAAADGRKPATSFRAPALDLEEAPEESELATTKWSSEPVTLTGSMGAGVLSGAQLG